MAVRPYDIALPVARLDFNSVQSHIFITWASTWDNLQYKLLFFTDINNPHFFTSPGLFDLAARHGNSFPKEELNNFLAAMDFNNDVDD